MFQMRLIWASQGQDGVEAVDEVVEEAEAAINQAFCLFHKDGAVT